MNLATRAAIGALRAVTDALEAGEGDPRAVLAALLGGPAPSPTPAAAPVEAAEPAPPPRDRARQKRRRTPKPVTEPDGAQLAARLVEAHGSNRAAARAVGTSASIMSGWRGGASMKPESVVRLREAVAALDGGDEENAQDDEDAAREPDRPEAERLVDELHARHGSLSAITERFGIGQAVLERAHAGRPCSPAVLERLRQAAAQPPPVSLRGDAEATGPDQAG